MAIDPGTTLILITCLICTIALAFDRAEAAFRDIFDVKEQ